MPTGGVPAELVAADIDDIDADAGASAAVGDVDTDADAAAVAATRGDSQLESPHVLC